MICCVGDSAMRLVYKQLSFFRYAYDGEDQCLSPSAANDGASFMLAKRREVRLQKFDPMSASEATTHKDHHAQEEAASFARKRELMSAEEVAVDKNRHAQAEAESFKKEAYVVFELKSAPTTQLQSTPLLRRLVVIGPSPDLANMKASQRDPGTKRERRRAIKRATPLCRSDEGLCLWLLVVMWLCALPRYSLGFGGKQKS